MAFVTLTEPTEYLVNELAVGTALKMQLLNATDETFENAFVLLMAKANLGDPNSVATVQKLREYAFQSLRIRRELERRKKAQ